MRWMFYKSVFKLGIDSTAIAGCLSPVCILSRVLNLADNGYFCQYVFHLRAVGI